MSDADAKIELRLPAGMKDLLAKAAKAHDRPVASMARQLISRGLMALMEPLSVTDRLIHGVDCERSPITGKIYEQGSGALPREAQDKIALAEAKAGRKLSELEARLLIQGDPLTSAVDAAARSIDEVDK
jgi:hypothetical protein